MAQKQQDRGSDTPRDHKPGYLVKFRDKPSAERSPPIFTNNAELGVDHSAKHTLDKEPQQWRV